MNPFSAYAHTPVELSQQFSDAVRMGWVTEHAGTGRKVLLCQMDLARLSGNAVIQLSQTINDMSIEDPQGSLIVIVWGPPPTYEVVLSGELLQSINQNRSVIDIKYPSRVIIVSQKRVIIMTLITMLIGLAAGRNVRVEFASGLPEACSMASLPPLA